MKWSILIVGAIVIGLVVLGLVSFRLSVYREEQQFKQGITFKGLLFVAAGCDAYKVHKGKWPNSLEELHTFRTDLNSPWTQDSWGRDFIIVPFSMSSGYGEVISYGRDARPGGTGLDKDLSLRFPLESNKAWNEQEGVGLKFPGRVIDTNWIEENIDAIRKNYT